MSRTAFIRRGEYRVTSTHDTGSCVRTATTRHATNRLIDAVNTHVIECNARFIYNLTAVFEQSLTTEVRVIADHEDDEVSITHLAMVNVRGVGCN